MASGTKSFKLTEADKRISECLQARNSFVVDAGAGSGKTSSLVRTLNQLISGEAGAQLQPGLQKIACITYTNVAKDEIISRTGKSDVVEVSTIHDFLWKLLKAHQPALRRAVIQH